MLFLRNFRHDALLATTQFEEIGRAVTWLAGALVTGRSEEEQVAYMFTRFNPFNKVVAVGDCNERLPYSGAERMYFPRRSWQPRVERLIRSAKLVVIALGPGEGTMWELCQALRTLPPARIILLVPMTRLDYEQFRRHAESEFVRRDVLVRQPNGRMMTPRLPPRSLDDMSAAAHWHTVGRESAVPTAIKGAVYFSSNWEPVFAPLEVNRFTAALGTTD